MWSWRIAMVRAKNVTGHIAKGAKAKVRLAPLSNSRTAEKNGFRTITPGRG